MGILIEMGRTVEGYKLVAEMPLCMHTPVAGSASCGSEQGVDPDRDGTGRADGAAYVQRLDPQEVTGGGTMVFRIAVEKREGTVA